MERRAGTGVYEGAIVDTHYHVYDRGTTPYEGLLASAAMDATFTPDDYRRAMADANVEAGIVLNVVDRDFGFTEYEYIARIAATEPLISRYIPFCPLNEAGSLEAIRSYAGLPLVAGVRHNQLIPMHGQVPHVARAIDSLRELGAHGLVYEISARPAQHRQLAELAKACPETTIVLGHLGKPAAAVPPEPQWIEGIAALAKQPNVLCKLSCPVDSADDPPMTDGFLHPLIGTVVDRFGFDRVMFGTNFPTCNVALSARGWLRAIGTALDSPSPDERDRLYRRNACAAYRVPRAAAAGTT